MVQINFGQREVSCKVVFYGPGMSGKTTNLEIIHKKAPKDAVGEMVSIATETDRTLYFDFLPLDLGQVAGMRTKFQLYTVPGQIYYNATRKLVLQGVDGVIFVADSNPDKMAENLESLQNLRDNLAEMGLKLDDLPLVLQYNKRDLPSVLSIAEMDAQLNPLKVPVHEAVARDGKGVFATLKEISRLVIERLNRENAPAANRRRTAQNLPPQPATAGSGGHATLPSQPGSGGQMTLPPTPTTTTPSRPTPVVTTTPQRQPTLPPPPPPAAARPAPAPPRPAPAPAPVPPRPAPALQPPPRRLPTAAANATTPIAGTAADEPTARDRHLAKAKPTAIDKATDKAPDLGATDPTLKRYQESRGNGGGALKGAVIMLLVIVVLVGGFIALVVLVPAVRAQMPRAVQQLIVDSHAGPTSHTP
jgi:signal recognition particle receptor subunit beta